MGALGPRLRDGRGRPATLRSGRGGQRLQMGGSRGPRRFLARSLDPHRPPADAGPRGTGSRPPPPGARQSLATVRLGRIRGRCRAPAARAWPVGRPRPHSDRLRGGGFARRPGPDVDQRRSDHLAPAPRPRHRSDAGLDREPRAGPRTGRPCPSDFGRGRALSPAGRRPGPGQSPHPRARGAMGAQAHWLGRGDGVPPADRREFLPGRRRL